MKIGYVVQQFYPRAYGSGVHAFELLRELRNLGHEIHVITKGEPTQKKDEIYQNFHIHRILNGFELPYYFPFNSHLLWSCGKKTTEKLDLDIIIGHGFESSLFVSMRKKVPFVYKAAGTIGLQKNRQVFTWQDSIGKIFFPFLGISERIAIQHANITIAISEAIKSELINTYRINEKRITKIYNGVNIKRFNPALNYSELEKRLGLNGKEIILFVGRLSPIKGPQILIQAIRSILKKIPNAFFLFLGNGPLKTHLQKMSNEFQITQSLKFLGFIPNSEVAQYFAMANLTVIPSLYEPFGLVALESLASGTPILTSNRGGLSEIHKVLGEYPMLKSVTSSAISKEVVNLLQDKDQLIKLSEKGLRIVQKRFTWEKCAKKTEKVLKKVKKRE